MSVAVAGNAVNEAGADTTQATNPPLEERVSYQISISLLNKDIKVSEIYKNHYWVDHTWTPFQSYNRPKYASRDPR